MRSLGKLSTIKSHVLRRRSIITAALCLMLVISLIARPANAAIAYRATSTAENGGGSTQLSLTAPTGTTAGDIMIAMVTTRYGASGFTTAPNGWTLIAEPYELSGTISADMYYAAYSTVGAGPYVFTFPSAKAAGVVVSYSGVDQANPIDANTGAYNASSSTITAQSITTAQPNDMLVGMYATATGATLAQGGGMNIEGQVSSSGSGSTSTKITAGVQDATQATAGASGVKTMTASAGAVNIGFLAALRPAALVTQAGYRVFQNIDSTSAGTPLAATNTASSLAQDTPFRLRLNLGASSSGGAMYPGLTYKLQYAQQGSDGTCDTSFANETYADVTTGTPVAFYDNPTPADGAAYSTSANDPSRSGITSVGQYYNESNPLNIATNIPAGQDGLWDVALTKPSVNMAWVSRSPSSPQSWGPIASSADGQKLAVGTGAAGNIYTSTNGGASWTAQSSSGSHAWTTLAGSSDGTKLIAGINGGQALASSDSGVTWATLAGSPSVYWYSIASSTDGTKLVAATASNIYTSTNSGSSWTQRAAIAGSAVASSADGTKLALVVNGGGVYTSTDSGATWNVQSGAGSQAWSAIASSSDGTKLVATVKNGSIYTSTDSGITWVQRTGAGTQNWASVTSSSDGSKLAVGVNGGYMYTSRDSGATWTRQVNAGSRNWLSIASSSDGVYLTASDNTSNSGYIYTLNQSLNSSSSTYCLRAVTPTGAVMSSYSVIPEIDPAPPTTTQADYRWFANADSATPGAALAAQDAMANVNGGTLLRLRQRIAVDTSGLVAGSGSYKLQYAEKVGTCDTAFSGESYADVGMAPSKFSTSAVEQAPSGGSVAWSSGVATLKSADGQYTGVGSAGASVSTNQALLTGYSFSIPSSATITGISVTIPYNVSVISPSYLPSMGMNFVKGGSSISGTQSQSYSTSGTGTTVIGGKNNTLGISSLTPATVNDSTFGLSLSVNAQTDSYTLDDSSIFLDSASITIYYTNQQAISYADNPTPASGAAISSVSGDPTNGARPTVYQTYLEADAFSNATATIPSGSDGLWDFALNTSGLGAGKNYCFRIVKADGSPLNSYVQVPELGILATGPTLEQQLGGGEGVVNGIKSPFSW